MSWRLVVMRSSTDVMQSFSAPAQLRRRIVQSPALVAVLALVLGGLIGTATAFGPIYAFAGIFALLVGYALLVSTEFGLISVFAIIMLLPFGTLPFKAIITPNFLELALAALMGVWILRLLARSDAYQLDLTPLGLPILGFVGLTFFSLFLGAQGLPDSATLHNYLKFVLGVLLFFSIANCIQNREQARLMMRAVILCGGLAALMALVLYMLNDQLALNILVALGRIGYPTEGRVLRFVEDDTNGLERAIGFSVDPNSFGGMLALVSILTATQLFAKNPLLPRWLLGGIVSLMGLVVVLTFSRAALLGLVIGAVYLAIVRYRKLWGWMLIGGVVGAILLFAAGIADEFIERFAEGLTFQDQAQQMRLDEFNNAFAIIERYPAFGIGFGQAPDIDLTAGVSNIYLAIGQRMGLIGLAAFLGLVAAWFIFSIRALPTLDDERADWALGTQAGIITAMAVGLADHYFFNIEFSHMVALFWGILGLGMIITTLPNDNAQDHLQTG